MKKITILLATLFSTGLFAQNTDTTKVEIGNLKIIVNGDEVKIFSDTSGKGSKVSTSDDYDYNSGGTSKSDEDYDYNDDHEGNNSTGDTVRISFGKKLLTITDNGVNYDTETTPEEKAKKMDKDKKHNLTHWSGIDLGLNGYMTSANDLDLGKKNSYLELDYGKSRVISFNFAESKIRIAKDYVGITTGLGLQYNNYILKNDNLLKFKDDTLTTYNDTSITNLRKNKLRSTYLRIPLLLEFNTSQNYKKSLHLAAGVVGGLNIGSMYKIKYTKNDNDQKDKAKRLKTFNPFQLDAMVRIGYGDFTLFGTVGLLPLFQDGEAPELNTFSAGIAFNI